MTTYVHALVVVGETGYRDALCEPHTILALSDGEGPQWRCLDGVCRGEILKFSYIRTMDSVLTDALLRFLPSRYVPFLAEAFPEYRNLDDLYEIQQSTTLNKKHRMARSLFESQDLSQVCTLFLAVNEAPRGVLHRSIDWRKGLLRNLSRLRLQFDLYRRSASFLRHDLFSPLEMRFPRQSVGRIKNYFQARLNEVD